MNDGPDAAAAVDAPTPGMLVGSGASARGLRRAGGLDGRVGLRVVALYTATMFLSAALLFLVQPLFARMVLPRMGGSPAVWNTAVVFYQVVLLAGYLYAHATTRWLTIRQQIALHSLLVLAPLVVLPIAVPSDFEPPTAGTPIWALLGLLTVSVGLPFFVVSATSPLLQAWFSRTGHRSAGDPYFLYAASNVGSMLGLLAYPLALEPRLRLTEQSWFWTGGYIALMALMAGSAAVVWRRDSTTVTPAQPAAVAELDRAPVTNRRRVQWVLLAAVPSSLMLSVTTYLATTIAPLPLLWAIPLSLYLLTFILVFSKRQILPQGVLRRALPILVLTVLLFIIAPDLSDAALLPVHLLIFFVAAMVCHGALAEDRPGAGQLTEFYLWMSLGGAVGGAFTALLAPVVFESVAEYPLAIALLCGVAPAGAVAAVGRISGRQFDFLLPGVVTVAAVALLLTVRAATDDALVWLMAFTIPLVACYGFSRRPLRWGLGIGGVVVAALLLPANDGSVLHTDRNFYGVKEVVRDDESQRVYLVHGGIVHGAQSTEEGERTELLTYYTRSGPLGDVFEAMYPRGESLRVGVLGMGAAAAACYARPEDNWTFYEIDPQVVSIARNPKYFTYLRDCTPGAAVVLGDARIAMEDALAGGYDVLILDAYSSDAIPVHLITREALALYAEKLAPGGVMAFHISNRYFDLEPVVASLAYDAGLMARIRKDTRLSEADRDGGKTGSTWVTLARTEADLGRLREDGRWSRLRGRDSRVWTDDYSSLLSVLRWDW